MISVTGRTWKMESVPERLILKKKQDFDISLLLSKIFLTNKYTDDEIFSSLNKKLLPEINYEDDDFIKASIFFTESLKKKEKILIFGDYDVDGFSSTYLLHDFIKNMKIECDYYIPDRFYDGYGPNKELLEKLLNKKSYKLVFFVDCATNSYEEIDYLEKNGIKTIIIDHHQSQKEIIRKKTVIINPLKNNSNNHSSYFCATTLVYFFLKYMNDILNINNIDFKKYLFFSAIGTICDQMPLRNINRSIVKIALKNFSIQKFKKFNKILKFNSQITSSEIAFLLGPIFNSSSRMGNKDLVIKLLLEKNANNINKISNKLLDLNEKRKEIQNTLFKSLNEKTKVKDHEIIFIYEKNINEGLLGVIAANFVELYNKPCFVLTNSNNLIKSSCRSINGYNLGNILHDALNKKIILKGGGHSMAGGCTFHKNKLAEFRNYLNKMYKKNFTKIENFNYYVSEQSIKSLKLFAKYELQILEPFGNKNLNPSFLIKNNQIIKLKILKKIHIQVIIKNNHRTVSCYAFNSVNTKIGYILMNYKKKIDFIVQINNKIIQKNSDFNLIIKDVIV